ncbi:hypothetical protein B0T17DRAFT_369539 [Bombardia bombarda]|uniref:Secreted protein n=1 Tax=Bombardia bombarda TaxID=252184 RepID=A0AA39WGC5_9PEZI|nr:hypothetical protein B0T17DRAFT_369539 [Bombardia bombarda]
MLLTALICIIISRYASCSRLLLEPPLRRPASHNSTLWREDTQRASFKVDGYICCGATSPNSRLGQSSSKRQQPKFRGNCGVTSPKRKTSTLGIDMFIANTDCWLYQMRICSHS